MLLNPYRFGGGGGGGMPSYWNPADKSASIALSNSDQTASGSAVSTGVRALQSRASGIYQFEVFVTDIGATDSLYIGIAGATTSLGGGPGTTSGSGTGAAIGYRATGALWTNGSAATSPTDTFTTGDVIGVVLDFGSTSARYRFYKNGVVQQTLTDTGIATITGPIFPMVGNGGSNTTWQLTLNNPLTYPVSGAIPWG